MSGEDPGPADLTLLLQGLAGTYLRNPLRTDGGCARCAGVTSPGFAESASSAAGSTVTDCPTSPGS